MKTILPAFRRLLALAGVATLFHTAGTASASQLIYDLRPDAQ